MIKNINKKIILIVLMFQLKFDILIKILLIYKNKLINLLNYNFYIF